MYNTIKVKDGKKNNLIMINKFSDYIHGRNMSRFRNRMNDWVDDYFLKYGTVPRKAGK